MSQDIFFIAFVKIKTSFKCTECDCGYDQAEEQ